MEDTELEAQGSAFIARFLAADAQGREALRIGGAALAGQLRGAAIALAYSRATEFSPLLPRYHQLAAQVALLTFWPDTRALATFERDLECFRNFERTRILVEEYERFRAAYLNNRSDL